MIKWKYTKSKQIDEKIKDKWKWFDIIETKKFCLDLEKRNKTIYKGYFKRFLKRLETQDD